MTTQTTATVPGTEISLYNQATWSRATVADGKWLQNETLEPISANDRILASAINYVSGGVDDLTYRIDLLEDASDVINVYGTWTDFVTHSGELFDTSAITNNDIIKVLNDPNQYPDLTAEGGHQTYFRWSADNGSIWPLDPTEGQWEYIGYIEPYYNKNEVDTIIDDLSATVKDEYVPWSATDCPIGDKNKANSYSLAQGSANSASYDSFAQGKRNEANGQSIAVGVDNYAKNQSQALGSTNSATSDGFAAGSNNSATTASFAQGSTNYARNSSFAQGTSNSASTQSFAQGKNNSADYDAFAQGLSAFANNESLAQGLEVTAKSKSFAQGSENNADIYGFAQGANCSAKTKAFAQGLNITATDYAFGQGQDNTIEDHSFAQGTNNTAQYTAFAQGITNNVTGNAFGQGTSNTAMTEALAQGTNNDAEINSFAQGKANTAISYSFAQGYKNEVNSVNEPLGISFAQGYANTADFISFAQGRDNLVSDKSFAQGSANTALENGFARGLRNHANGGFANGADNTAVGTGALAIGANNYAGNYAQALGHGVKMLGSTDSLSRGGMAIGTFNKTTADLAFVIGNGLDDSRRSDLYWIDYNGNVYTEGNVSANNFYINGNPIDSIVSAKFSAYNGDTKIAELPISAFKLQANTAKYISATSAANTMIFNVSDALINSASSGYQASAYITANSGNFLNSAHNAYGTLTFNTKAYNANTSSYGLTISAGQGISFITGNDKVTISAEGIAYAGENYVDVNNSTKKIGLTGNIVGSAQSGKTAYNILSSTKISAVGQGLSNTGFAYLSAGFRISAGDNLTIATAANNTIQLNSTPGINTYFSNEGYGLDPTGTTGLITGISAKYNNDPQIQSHIINQSVVFGTTGGEQISGLLIQPANTSQDNYVLTYSTADNSYTWKEGGIQQVYHDSNLSGNGTQDSLLGLNNVIKLSASDGQQTTISNNGITIAGSQNNANISLNTINYGSTPIMTWTKGETSENIRIEDIQNWKAKPNISADKQMGPGSVSSLECVSMEYVDILGGGPKGLLFKDKNNTEVSAHVIASGITGFLYSYGPNKQIAGRAPTTGDTMASSGCYWAGSASNINYVYLNDLNNQGKPLKLIMPANCIADIFYECNVGSYNCLSENILFGLKLTSGQNEPADYIASSYINFPPNTDGGIGIGHQSCMLRVYNSNDQSFEMYPAFYKGYGGGETHDANYNIGSDKFVIRYYTF